VKNGTIQIDGADFKWSVFRQPRWSNTGGHKLLGLAILVESPTKSHRELLLEFSIDRTLHGDMPQHQRFRINEKRLSECIRAAMAAGWDPTSRGKLFRFDAGNPN
jgi:hypothetical protein